MNGKKAKMLRRKALQFWKEKRGVVSKAKIYRRMKKIWKAME